MKTVIHTSKAPSAIGPYSQAIQSGHLVFLSGQIALQANGELIQSDNISDHTRQIFLNLEAITNAAGAKLDQIVKLTIYLTDLNDFSAVNAVMTELFQEPYPARATIQVAALPKGVPIEIDAILSLV